jgi:tRNA pseudouridine55 synthase
MKNESWTAETFRDPGVTLFIDKPLGWTSYQVVRKMRSLFDVKKVGHAGTLDPKASGLLILCTGKRTRDISTFMDLEKEYTGTLELGIRTPSFDLETPVSERKDPSGVTHEAVEEIALQLTGNISQQPPMYSALKMGGTPLYRFARKGIELHREPRLIRIEHFEIVNFVMPLVEFRVVCSKGTYIRSLADEMGQRLGCGATLTALRRTRIGPHHVNAAMSVETLALISREIGIVRQPRHADRSAH